VPKCLRGFLECYLYRTPHATRKNIFPIESANEGSTGNNIVEVRGDARIVVENRLVFVSVWCSKWQTCFGAFDVSGYSEPEGSLSIGAHEDDAHHILDVEGTAVMGVGRQRVIAVPVNNKVG
jgi:hypothetical protein